MKAVVRGKPIALSASKKKRDYTSSLTAYLKALKQKEANIPKRSRWQEIIKLRAEINQIETKGTIQSTKPGAGSLRKFAKHMKLKKKEDQSVDTLLLLRMGNKINMEGVRDKIWS